MLRLANLKMSFNSPFFLKLNNKVFNESMFAVSFARPRKTFNRNTSYERNEYDRQMSSNSYEQPGPMNASYSYNTNPNSASPSVSMASSPVKSANSSKTR